MNEDTMINDGIVSPETQTSCLAEREQMVRWFHVWEVEIWNIS